MRKLVLASALSLCLAAPALAAGWTAFQNKKFGLEISVPPDFVAAGVAAPEGQTFRAKRGLIELRVYGQVIPNADFDAYVKKAIAFDHSYYGWTIRGKTITPSWAEYYASHGAQQLKVRIITACHGRHALAAWFSYSGNMETTVSKVFASLKAGPATSCPN